VNKIAWVIQLLIKLAEEGYTGKVEVNFYSGGVSNVNKFESISKPKE
jgi:hypothetical protein